MGAVLVYGLLLRRRLIAATGKIVDLLFTDGRV